MYKNLEVLGKETHKKVTYDVVSPIEVGKSLKLIPVGFMEVLDMSAIAPIIIMGEGDDKEFIGLFGILDNVSVFNKQQLIAPLYTKTYPFVNIKVKNENDELSNVIGIDNNSEYVGEDKATAIFDEKGELVKQAATKVEMVRELNRQRDISKAIIKELEANNLLVEKDFTIKINGEEKKVLEKFLVIDREKLYKVSNKKIIDWAKKGWLTLFDAHIRSLNNFRTVVTA